MRIHTFLPHVGVFGGVRRFLELGNEWTALGHEVIQRLDRIERDLGATETGRARRRSAIAS